MLVNLDTKGLTALAIIYRRDMNIKDFAFHSVTSSEYTHIWCSTKTIDLLTPKNIATLFEI